MTQYYVTAEGAYIGGFDGIDPPAGAIEVPGPPPVNAAQVWGGTGWLPYVPPVPAAVTPLQARKALRAAGMMPAVNDWLAAQDEITNEEWEYATQIERDNPAIAAAAVGLDLTEADLDDLFRTAATL